MPKYNSADNNVSLDGQLPNITPGDIVRISHSASWNATIKGTEMSKIEKTLETKCYQVRTEYSIEVECWSGKFTERFDKRNILAVYRWDGMDYRCIWEREDYTAQRQTECKYAVQNTVQFIGKVVSFTAMFIKALKELQEQLKAEKNAAEKSLVHGGDEINGQKQS